MSLSHSIYKTTSSVEIINPKLITIVFGHHPCPDGIAAIVCLAEKFGSNRLAKYVVKLLLYDLIIFKNISPDTIVTKFLYLTEKGIRPQDSLHLFLVS